MSFNTTSVEASISSANEATRETHLNCWCSLELRILDENLSANFSKLREYSSSISALRRKNSCRSCSSWIRDSDCCSKHLNCSTSWLRISVHQNRKQKWRESTVDAALFINNLSSILWRVLSLFTIEEHFSQVFVFHILISCWRMVFCIDTQWDCAGLWCWFKNMTNNKTNRFINPPVTDIFLKNTPETLSHCESGFPQHFL